MKETGAKKVEEFENDEIKILRQANIKTVVLEKLETIRLYHEYILLSTGASKGSFDPIFNKRFDHLETSLAIHRPKKVLSAGSLWGSLMPGLQSKCPKRTFMLSQKYHASVSNMLS